MTRIADLRREYMQAGLDESDVDPDALKQFQKWFGEAVLADVDDVNAMTLSTVTADGWPDARIVLLKGVEDGALRFFTNYRSAKGRQLEACPRATLSFFWGALERQVRLRGEVERLGGAASDAYFRSRPRGSQIGAHASQQSEALPDRATLEAEALRLEALYPEGSDVPRPAHWGGYAVKPVEIEFWQGRPNRLHDRIRCVRDGDRWVHRRLSP